MLCKKQLLITRFRVPKSSVKKDQTGSFAIDMKIPEFLPQYNLNSLSGQIKSQKRQQPAD